MAYITKLDLTKQARIETGKTAILAGSINLGENLILPGVARLGGYNNPNILFTDEYGLVLSAPLSGMTGGIGTSGATSFLQLTDTPFTYSGYEGHVVIVSGSSLVFTMLSGATTSESPVLLSGLTTNIPSGKLGGIDTGTYYPPMTRLETIWRELLIDSDPYTPPIDIYLTGATFNVNNGDLTLKKKNDETNVIVNLDGRYIQSGYTYSKPEADLNFIRNQDAVIENKKFRISGNATVGDHFYYGKTLWKNGNRILHTTGTFNETSLYLGVNAGNLNVSNTGASVIGIGQGSFSGITSGSRNIGIGTYTASGITSGSDSIYVGNNINASSTLTNNILIGHNLSSSVNNVVLIGDTTHKIGFGISPTYKLDLFTTDLISARFSGRVIGDDAIELDEFITLGQGNDLYVPYTGATKNIDLGTNHSILQTITTGYGHTIIYSGTDNAIDVTNSSTGKATYINNISGGIGIDINNSSTGYGIYLNNSSNGYGFQLTNSNTARGLHVDNTNTGRGISVTNSSTGIGIDLFNGSSGNGVHVSNSSSGNGYSVSNNTSGKGIYVSNINTSIGIDIANTSTGTGVRIFNTGGTAIDINTTLAGAKSININHATAATGNPFTYTKNSVTTTTLSDIGRFTTPNITITNLQAATTDVDKFIVSDGGDLKFRTGAEVRADIDLSATYPIFYSSGTGIISSIPASASDSGYVTTGSQTFSGSKTFQATIYNDPTTYSSGGYTLVVKNNSTNAYEEIPSTTYTTSATNITINGSTQNLTTDRTWTITTTGTPNRITVSGGGGLTPTIDIASTYVGQTSITTLGTIGTGTWQGTPIADTYISSSVIWHGKQDALIGTGFVKSTGGVISYDNSTYYLASNPNGYTSNAGTVTSVNMSVPTGLSIAGNPITTSGTLALTLTAGYVIPTTTDISNGNTAYSWGNHAGLYKSISYVPAWTDVTGKPTGVSYFTNDAGYLTSFTEVDTIDTVLGRGNTAFNKNLGIENGQVFITKAADDDLSTGARLQLNDSVTATRGAAFHLGDDGDMQLQTFRTGTWTTRVSIANVNGAMTVGSDITADNFIETSDIRLKNIVNKKFSANGITAIAWTWKDAIKGTNINYGYSAQQVQNYMPEAVFTNNNGFLSINYTAVLVAKVEDLEDEIKKLKEQLNGLGR